MALVVLVIWMSLAVGAEVGVMANGTLVANAMNIALVACAIAQWTIAIDATMTGLSLGWSGYWLVNFDEAMTMGATAFSNAVAAEVEVGAVETLVTNTVDGLRKVSIGSTRTLWATNLVT